MKQRILLILLALLLIGAPAYATLTAPVEVEAGQSAPLTHDELRDLLHKPDALKAMGFTGYLEGTIGSAQTDATLAAMGTDFSQQLIVTPPERYATFAITKADTNAKDKDNGDYTYEVKLRYKYDVREDGPLNLALSIFSTDLDTELVSNPPQEEVPTTLEGRGDGEWLVSFIGVGAEPGMKAPKQLRFELSDPDTGDVVETMDYLFK